MAAAPPSPLASSLEKTNGAKLSRLLIDGGTAVLRNVFDSYHPPANLAADLNANYLTLNNLLRRRVLRTAQWDQLFPPAGATPDSKTFDITLLFLLLTNICGLTPPLSGWHKPPPSSDTSREANLARIKFYRNELHGHVTTTGVDALTFNALWLEISAVLVALGLDQAEIDRLKGEHCGEDDYLDVLRDWIDNEQDIKSQLKDIHQCQTETQQGVEKILENLAEVRNTLANSISKLGQVHQIESKTHDAVKQARQIQLEDHETLHDTILRLDEMHQVECETYQAIKDASQTQTETRQAVEEVHETLQEVKREVENLKRKRVMDRTDDLLKKLAKSEFKGDIEYHAHLFQEGTREWIFKKVDDWLDDKSSPNRVMVISGAAGMGKSVISAVICKRMQDAGRLSGSHFCQHNYARYRNPQLMLQSLACHLSHALTEYNNALVEQLSRNLGPVELNCMGVEELFALLFKEPLSKILDPGRNILMVIDGLDESEYQGRNELLDVIANQFCKLPQWIRFFVTTRTEINIAESLKHLQPIQLEDNRNENLRDIQLFFEMQLINKIDENHKDVLLRKLVDKSEGVFLYAYFLKDFIQKNVSLLTPEQLESTLPLRISSVYLSHFKRLENELCKELKIEEDQMLNFLCALTASREPLPVAFVPGLLNLSRKPFSVQRKINKAIACISSLLPVRDDCLHFFHKSVKDWLTNTSCYGQHEFTVDEKEGHEILFNLCRNELDNIKRKGVHDTQFSDTERYALQHGVQHMIEVHKSDEKPSPFSVEELVNMYVTDVELFYAKLCVNSTATTEDLLVVQKHVKSALLSEKNHSLITSLSSLLRKHCYVLRDHPHLIFQCLVNEGCPELSCRATTIVENDLLNVPYMKYLNREEQKGAVQARFYCSDTVACFDVSPQMDYMVCECRDGRIYMWSLETGNLEWVRPSLMERKYESVHPYGDIVADGGAYREIRRPIDVMNVKGCNSILTFYRSVVFHPSGSSVLPGTLRSVYTLNGDKNDLFPDSKCIFSHCAFPRDKKAILTDCSDDPKMVVLWSMKNGEVVLRIEGNDVISSFAISQDGSQIGFGDLTGSFYLVDVDRRNCRNLFQYGNAGCALMHFTPDNKALVCGYFHYRIDDLGNRQYGWVSHFNKPTFSPCEIDSISTRLSVCKHLPTIDFVLWPIEPRTLPRIDFFKEGLLSSWVNKVHSVFPSLQTGFYKKLNDETALVGGPSFKYVAAVNVDVLNEVSSASNSQVVTEVVFSLEGDAIYSISSDGNEYRASEVLVSIIRMSSQEFLMKKSFTCPSLSLFPMKEGVVLCLKDEVPQLWNFDLTECIRPITRPTGSEKLLRLSNELIACQLPWRALTPNELSVFGHSSGVEDSLEQNESLDFDSSNEGGSSFLDDSSDLENSAVFRDFLVDFFHSMTFLVFGMLVVDIINVSSGECVSSVKTRVQVDDHILFISCNSHNQLLVCTSEEIDDDVFDIEQLTVSLRNDYPLKRVWERSTKRYDGNSFTPHFIFSPKDEFIVTWGSFDWGHGLHILDSKTGETRHTLLKDQDDIIDLKFVGNCDTLICCCGDNFLRLFNIQSGDLLSVLDIEERPYCLGACLGNPLVAIGLSGPRLKYIHVRLPSVTAAEDKKG